MDLATLIGLIGGAAVIVAAILVDSSLITFINLPSLLIVFGGTFAVTLVKFPIKAFLNAFKVATKAFVVKLDRPQETIQQAIKLSSVVRREGLLALEHQKVKNHGKKLVNLMDQNVSFPWAVLWQKQNTNSVLEQLTKEVYLSLANQHLLSARNQENVSYCKYAEIHTKKYISYA